MINAERIEEMKRLSTEALPGPWVSNRAGGVYTEDEEFIDDFAYGKVAYGIDDEADAQFIAESRQFVPSIIEAFEKQAEEIEHLKRSLAFIANRRESNSDWMTAHNALAVYGWPKGAY